MIEKIDTLIKNEDNSKVKKELEILKNKINRNGESELYTTIEYLKEESTALLYEDYLITINNVIQLIENNQIVRAQCRDRV